MRYRCDRGRCMAPFGGLRRLQVFILRRALKIGRVARAVILTVGNEIVSGDTENTNASWLARRRAGLGVEVRLIAAVRDEIKEIAAFLRAESLGVEHVFVTGGLG